MGAYVNFCEFSALFCYDETLSTGDDEGSDGSVGEFYDDFARELFPRPRMPAWTIRDDKIIEM